MNRVCEELTYFCEDLYQVPVFQLAEVDFASFQQGVASLKAEKFSKLLE